MRAKGAQDVYFQLFWDRLTRRDVFMYEFRQSEYNFILLEPYLENVAK